MLKRHRTVVGAAGILLSVTACHRVHTATDLQVERLEEMRHDPRQHWRDMADNALLHDMSLADMHFVPHTAELNGTGVARLDRLSPLLDVYGGTVRYDTELTDDALVQKRLVHVREYIAMSGCNMDRVQVKTMMSGGRGMTAEEAIGIRRRGTQPGQVPPGVRPASAQPQAAPALGTGSSQ